MLVSQKTVAQYFDRAINFVKENKKKTISISLAAVLVVGLAIKDRLKTTLNIDGKNVSVENMSDLSHQDELSEGLGIISNFRSEHLDDYQNLPTNEVKQKNYINKLLLASGFPKPVIEKFEKLNSADRSMVTGLFLTLDFRFNRITTQKNIIYGDKGKPDYKTRFSEAKDFLYTLKNHELFPWLTTYYFKTFYILEKYPHFLMNNISTTPGYFYTEEIYKIIDWDLFKQLPEKSKKDYIDIDQQITPDQSYLYSLHSKTLSFTYMLIKKIKNTPQTGIGLPESSIKLFEKFLERFASLKTYIKISPDRSTINISLKNPGALLNLLENLKNRSNVANTTDKTEVDFLIGHIKRSQFQTESTTEIFKKALEATSKKIIKDLIRSIEIDITYFMIELKTKGLSSFYINPDKMDKDIDLILTIKQLMTNIIECSIFIKESGTARDLEQLNKIIKPLNDMLMQEGQSLDLYQIISEPQMWQNLMNTLLGQIKTKQLYEIINKNVQQKAKTAKFSILSTVLFALLALALTEILRVTVKKRASEKQAAEKSLLEKEEQIKALNELAGNLKNNIDHLQKMVSDYEIVKQKSAADIQVLSQLNAVIENQNNELKTLEAKINELKNQSAHRIVIQSHKNPKEVFKEINQALSNPEIIFISEPYLGTRAAKKDLFLQLLEQFPNLKSLTLFTKGANGKQIQYAKSTLEEISAYCEKRKIRFTGILGDNKIHDRIWETANESGKKYQLTLNNDLLSLWENPERQIKNEIIMVPINAQQELPQNQSLRQYINIRTNSGYRLISNTAKLLSEKK